VGGGGGGEGGGEKRKKATEYCERRGGSEETAWECRVKESIRPVQRTRGWGETASKDSE